MLNDDSEAYLSSPAFIPRVSLDLAFIYNISSSDISVDVMIVSQLTGHVLRWHSLPQQQHAVVVSMPNTSDSIYVLLHAYTTSTSTATSSSSSVAIPVMMLIPYLDCE